MRYSSEAPASAAEALRAPGTAAALRASSTAAAIPAGFPSPMCASIRCRAFGTPCQESSSGAKGERCFGGAGTGGRPSAEEAEPSAEGPVCAPAEAPGGDWGTAPAPNGNDCPAGAADPDDCP